MAASPVCNVLRIDYSYSTFIDVREFRVRELVRLSANISIISEDFFKLPYTALKSMSQCEVQGLIFRGV